MTFEDFKKLIMGTPLLTEEDKQKHIQKAKDATPELLDRKAAILENGEKKFLEKIKKINEKVREEARQNIKEQFVSLKEKERQSSEKEKIQMAALEDEIMGL